MAIDLLQCGDGRQQADLRGGHLAGLHSGHKIAIRIYRGEAGLIGGGDAHAVTRSTASCAGQLAVVVLALTATVAVGQVRCAGREAEPPGGAGGVGCYPPGRRCRSSPG